MPSGRDPPSDVPAGRGIAAEGRPPRCADPAPPAGAADAACRCRPSGGPVPTLNVLLFRINLAASVPSSTSAVWFPRFPCGSQRLRSATDTRSVGGFVTALLSSSVSFLLQRVRCCGLALFSTSVGRQQLMIRLRGGDASWSLGYDFACGLHHLEPTTAPAGPRRAAELPPAFGSSSARQETSARPSSAKRRPCDGSFLQNNRRPGQNSLTDAERPVLKRSRSYRMK